MVIVYGTMENPREKGREEPAIWLLVKRSFIGGRGVHVEWQDRQHARARELYLSLGFLVHFSLCLLFISEAHTL
jgi:hypothetical protein